MNLQPNEKNKLYPFVGWILVLGLALAGDRWLNFLRIQNQNAPAFEMNQLMSVYPTLTIMLVSCSLILFWFIVQKTMPTCQERLFYITIPYSLFPLN